jgi:hypothetical protein
MKTIDNRPLLYTLLQPPSPPPPYGGHCYPGDASNPEIAVLSSQRKLRQTEDLEMLALMIVHLR